MVHQGFGIPMDSEFLKYLHNYFAVPLQNFHVYSIDYFSDILVFLGGAVGYTFF